MVQQTENNLPRRGLKAILVEVMSHREIPILSLPDSLVSVFEESPRHRSSELKVASELKEQRRLEFELGRILAQRVLIQAGWKGYNGSGLSPAIGKDDDRSPIWPAGFVGSISHSDRWVWVAVARANEFVSIGIDTEVLVDPTRAMELRNSIGRDQEWQRMAAQGFSDSIAFTLLFSAKEAFFKLCYPLTKVFWEFQDLEVVSVRMDALPQNAPAGELFASSGEIFLRFWNNDSDPNPRDERPLLSPNLSHDFQDRAHPVAFQIIGQDVFTFAMIRSQ